MTEPGAHRDGAEENAAIGISKVEGKLVQEALRKGGGQRSGVDRESLYW